jgi:hypothetical protein
MKLYFRYRETSPEKVPSSSPLPCQILELLQPRDLAQLAQASRAFYVYCHHADLWRETVLRICRQRGCSFAYQHSWKDTCVALLQQLHKPESTALLRHQPIAMAGVYSDMLYEPWAYALMEIDPRWLSAETIPRCSSLSVEEFARTYDTPLQPVIFTHVADAWPALEKWTDEYLINHAVRGGSEGPVEWGVNLFLLEPKHAVCGRASEAHDAGLPDVHV